VLRAPVAAVLIALASAGAASASCRDGQLRPAAVASGKWGGVSWTLQAIDSGDLRYGMTVIVAGARRASLSGRFHVPGHSGAPVTASDEFGWTSSMPGTSPAFVAGVVAEAARKITVSLSDGEVRTVRTIPPRCLLQPDISFFIVTTLRGTQPRFFTARSATGRVVGRWRA
jgi:hypothetical protein